LSSILADTGFDRVNQIGKSAAIVSETFIRDGRIASNGSCHVSEHDLRDFGVLADATNGA